MKLPRVYLYLSTAKLDQLIEQESTFFANISAKIDFTLPFVSGGLSGTKNISKNIAKLERIEKQLRRKYSIPSFDEIPSGSSPVFIYFKGRAVRTVRNKEFWLAVDHPHTALLLAGSASFAMGNKIDNRDAFSPSADPVGAFVRACNCKESNKKLLDQSVSGSVSYIWLTLLEDSLRSHASLPSVEGLAIFATTLPATGNFARVRRPHVEKVVVGTPLFVRQIEDQQATKSPEEELLESRKRFLVRVSSSIIWNGQTRIRRRSVPSYTNCTTLAIVSLRTEYTTASFTCRNTGDPGAGIEHAYFSGQTNAI